MRYTDETVLKVDIEIKLQALLQECEKGKREKHRIYDCQQRRQPKM